MKRIIFCYVLLLSACAYGQNSAIQLQPITTGLSAPVLATNAHDGSNRIFIVEQTGKIKVLQPEVATATDFVNLSTKITYGGERGLLGLAFHPDFKNNRRFFVNYTRSGDGATTIAEYQASTGNRNVAATTEKILLTIAQPFANHNGGMIEFGQDGYLYIGMGDGGSANDPGSRAQNIEELLGKMLRIDVDHTTGALPYGIPPDNPFVGNVPGRDEIFAVGLRNPWRWSFDRLTGQLYAGDVGQNAIEEIDIVTKGGNYGWRVFEGNRCTNNDPTLCTASNYIAPIFQYPQGSGRCSVTGGYVYRGARSTFPDGAYLYGDYCTGEIFQLKDGQNSLLLDTDLNTSLSAFGEDEGGEILVCDLNGGKVFRLTNTSSPKPLGTVSAASYDRESGVAPDSIVATFGNGLANGTYLAPALPLPTSLGGTTVTIRDSKGVERLSPLFCAGNLQVNFLVPTGSASGYGAVIVKVNNAVVSSGALKIDSFAPAIFSANQDGSGAAAAILQIIKNDISTYSPLLAEKDPTDLNGVRLKTVAIDLNQSYDKLYLLLYGTAIRGRGEPLTATATAGGVALPIEYAGAQNFFPGVDQLNILLAKSLQGKGEVDLAVTINGKTANLVKVNFK